MKAFSIIFLSALVSSVWGRAENGIATVDALEAALAVRDEANDREWAAVADAAALSAKTSAFRETFRKRIGFDRIVRTPLNARSMGMRDYDGFRIEKVLLESAPGALVTALVFLPDAAKFPPPYAGFMFIPGHANEGKANLTYLRTCELGARNGLAAIIYDPLGQGERSQGAKLRSADEHVRIGAYAALLGETTATYMLRDAVRVFDYFAGRDDIDAGRLGVSGNSGGGTMSAFFMVADGRVKAATPSCYLSSVREHVLACGPQDAEQNFFDALSWGFNHAALVMSAGCPVLINAAVQDFFQIEGSRSTYRLVAQVASRLGVDRAGAAGGWAWTTGDPGSWGYYALSEAPGRHAMSQVHRERSVAFLLRHLKGEVREVCETVTNAFVAADWQVTPKGEVSELPGFKSVYEVLAEKFVQCEVSVDNAAANAGALVRQELAGDDSRAVLSTLKGDVVNGRRVVLHLGGKAEDGEVTVTLFADGGRYLIKPVRKGKKSYYENRKDDEVVAVDLYLAGRSLAALRAAELLVVAAELERRTGVKPELVAEGRYTVPAKFAVRSEPTAFVRVELRGESRPWLEMLKAREYLSFADSGAIYSGR